MSELLEQLDEKIAAYNKAKEALDDLGDEISSFTYDKRKKLRKEAIEELRERLTKAYGKEYAEKNIGFISRLTEVHFCKDCGNRNLGFCHCQDDW
jgi:predicted nuclease with TOPRIM domain